MVGSDGLNFFPNTNTVLLTEINNLMNWEQSAENRYLWVLRLTDDAYALEECEFAKHFDKGFIKHSNLTGGDKAYCAGEMWFLADNTVIINGSSGRYGPNDIDMLEDAAKEFQRHGLRVGYMGYSELGQPLVIIERESDVNWVS